MLSFSPQLQQLYLTSKTKQIAESSELEITTGQGESALFSADDTLK